MGQKNNFIKKLLLLVLLLLGGIRVRSQPGHLKFDHFGVKDGLPEANVQFIKQDSRGYVWMGTQNGVLRYDGYKPEVYRFGSGKDAASSFCSVVGMIEDNDHVLWFSTENNGLFRYNASTNTFTRYKYPQIPGKNDYIDQYFAVVDQENNIWSYYVHELDKDGTEVQKFNTKTGEFQFFTKTQKGSHYLNIKNVNKIIKSSDQSIWIATDNGAYKYDYKKEQFSACFGTAGTGGQENVNYIYEAPSKPGELWLNILPVDMGGAMRAKNFDAFILERFDVRNKTTKSFHPDHFPQLNFFNNIVNSIYEDKQHILWFATAHGLMSLNRKTEVFTGYLPADTSAKAYAYPFYGLAPAKNGSLWINSGKGLLNFDPVTTRFELYKPIPDDPYSVSGSKIEMLYDYTDHMLIDNSDNLWVAFTLRGVDKVNPLLSAFQNYAKTLEPGSYPGGNALDIMEGYDGHIWFVKKDGVYEWSGNGNSFKQVYQPSKQDSILKKILIDKNGLIYFINSKGFNVLNTKLNTVRSFPVIPNDSTTMTNTQVTQMMMDHTGKIWIATDGQGICSFDPKKNKFKRYPYGDGSGTAGNRLNDGTVSCLYEDKRGTIWIGANFGGLSSYNPNAGKFESYLFDGHTRLAPVTAITEDKKNRLWVGSYFDGLYEFDRKTGHYTRHINEENGLLFNEVVNICEDKSGFLWVSSERGLSRINPDDLSVKTFPFNVILPGKRLNGYYNSMITVNSHIVMSVENGISAFSPDQLLVNNHPPIVHIEKISYSDPKSNDSLTIKKTYGLKNIKLAWNQNKITFNYIALHFVNPSLNKYAYYLKGYDHQWIPAGTQRSVTYTNLSPGTYTFYVRASNSDGVWNNKGDSFTIVISPPWWETWWAWTLYVVLFVTSIYAFIAYRSRKLVREKHMLEENVAVRTKQLSEANKELSEKQEEITTQRDQLSVTLTDLKSTQKQLIQSEKMASLGELTAGIAHEIQNPLNFINNFSEVSRELILELKDEMDKGDTAEVKIIAGDIEQNLEKINHHGKRADAIVKGMLEHSRKSSGHKELTDINALGDEYLRLAYHGMRAKDKTFSAERETDFDSKAGKINVIGQDIGRVLLNLFNNAFYAVAEKAKTGGGGYQPTVTISTKRKDNKVTITVADNGNGIPKNITDKIFQPFFTTKPTGQGTGLGLSLSYDIIKAHEGEINVESKEGEGTKFIISLPV